MMLHHKSTITSPEIEAHGIEGIEGHSQHDLIATMFEGSLPAASMLCELFSDTQRRSGDAKILPSTSRHKVCLIRHFIKSAAGTQAYQGIYETP